MRDQAYFCLSVHPVAVGPAARERAIEDERHTLEPGDLGLRLTYFATGPVTGTNVPDDYCDVAVPFA